MALDVCKSHGLVEGQVFVLGRMGAHSEALHLMLASLHGMRDAELANAVLGAIDFVRQRPQESELWQARPPLVTLPSRPPYLPLPSPPHPPFGELLAGAAWPRDARGAHA